jgi:hypothetical protein
MVEETGVPGENHQPVTSHCQSNMFVEFQSIILGKLNLTVVNN